MCWLGLFRQFAYRCYLLSSAIAEQGFLLNISKNLHLKIPRHKRGIFKYTIYLLQAVELGNNIPGLLGGVYHLVHPAIIGINDPVVR